MSEHDGMNDFVPAKEHYRVKLKNVDMHLWRVSGDMFLALFVDEEGDLSCAFTKYPEPNAPTDLPDRTS